MKRMVLRAGDRGVIRVETARKDAARRYALKMHQNGDLAIRCVDENGRWAGNIRVSVAVVAPVSEVVHETPLVILGVFEYDAPVDSTNSERGAK